MGRGARDAYRRAPRDAPDPPWSVGTNLGEESTESGRYCSSKSKIFLNNPFFLPNGVERLPSTRVEAAGT